MNDTKNDSKKVVLAAFSAFFCLILGLGIIFSSN